MVRLTSRSIVGDDEASSRFGAIESSSPSAGYPSAMGTQDVGFSPVYEEALWLKGPTRSSR